MSIWTAIDNELKGIRDHLLREMYLRHSEDGQIETETWTVRENGEDLTGLVWAAGTVMGKSDIECKWTLALVINITDDTRLSGDGFGAVWTLTLNDPFVGQGFDVSLPKQGVIDFHANRDEAIAPVILGFEAYGFGGGR